MIVVLDRQSALKVFELRGKIRVAELRASMNGGLIDENLVQEIVAMKRQLDSAYCSLVTEKSN